MARIARIASGLFLLLAGILMLALPGPGIVTIVAGLAVLSRDVPAAARLRDWVKRRFAGYTDDVDPVSEPEQASPSEPTNPG